MKQECIQIYSVGCDEETSKLGCSEDTDGEWKQKYVR
jgi:hypothetical protein